MASGPCFFDLDETLVLTNTLEPLRKARRWKEVYAGFPKTSLPDGTLDFLKKLSGKVKVGVVTKSPASYAEKLLAHHKIEIAVLVAFHDVKKLKPDPEALLVAAEKLGIEPSGCIYVGDDANDVQAAKAAQCAPVRAFAGVDRLNSDYPLFVPVGMRCTIDPRIN